MDLPSTARPGQLRRERRREAVAARLMEQGLKLMAQKGLTACKVEEITKAAGVGKGTFFTHFPSKQAFVVRLVDMVLSDLARRVGTLGPANQGAQSLVAGVGGVHLRFFQLRQDAAQLITQALCLTQDGPEGEEIKARMQRHLDLVASLLAPASEQMGWPRERSGELALCLLALSCGFFSFGRPLGLGQDTPAPLVERMGRVLAQGLGKETL